MTFRVIAKRKSLDDEGYDRVLDMFEAHYEEMTPVDDDQGSRVYLVEASSQADASTLIGRMLDAAHIPEWPEHISGFSAETA